MKLVVVQVTPKPTLVVKQSGKTVMTMRSAAQRTVLAALVGPQGPRGANGVAGPPGEMVWASQNW